jgi:hypothetical protein
VYRPSDRAGDPRRYEIYVAEDCCGDVSQLAHDNAMKNDPAGAKPVTSLSVMLELQRDWPRRSA